MKHCCNTTNRCLPGFRCATTCIPAGARRIAFACLAAVGACLAGCSTVGSQRAELMGSDQLIGFLESEKQLGKARAAETLGDRLLTNAQIDSLLALIESGNAPKVRIQIVHSLARILERRSDEELDQFVHSYLLKIIPLVTSAEVCNEALSLAITLTDPKRDALAFTMRFMETNQHALVRYWALRFLVQYSLDENVRSEKILSSINRTLQKESNAAVAELASRELGRHIYDPALQTIEEISNSGDVRKFESAKFDGEEGRKTHADVLNAAIRYSEGIRFATGDL